MNKKDEIKRIKQAKKNGELYISPMVISPDETYNIFLRAIKEVLEEDNNNKHLTNKGGVNNAK